MTTIKDVAREANVSPATVSRVLRGTKRVNEPTRERVLAVVERLHYHPSAAARTLRGDPSQIVGVIVPNMANEFFIQVVKGIEDATAPLGMNLMVASSGGDVGRELPIIRAMIGHRVDGIILAPSGTAQHYANLAWEVPFVAVDRLVDGPPFDTFVEDNSRGVRFLLESVIALGHRCIGVICGPDHLYPMVARVKEIRTVATEHPEISLYLSPPQPWGVDGGRQATRTLLHHAPGITAFVSLQNGLTVGALLELRECRRRVPDDVSLVSFGIPLHNDALYVQVTGLEHQASEMGRAAGRQLVTRLLKGPAPQGNGVIAPRLVLGNSLSSPVGQDVAATCRAVASTYALAH